MRLACYLVCLFIGLWPLAARADPTIAFGQVTPGQSIEDIVASLPDAEWRLFRDGSAGPLVGAVGSGAVEFDGWRWTLRLGRTNPADGQAFSYSFELTRSGRYEREDQCQLELSRTVAALEPSLGAFESGDLQDIHPALASVRTREPQEVGVGQVSRAQVLARDRIRYEDRGQYIVAVRNVDLGAATRASVVAINTRDRIDGAARSEYGLVVGYLCFITIGFKAPAQPD